MDGGADPARRWPEEDVKEFIGRKEEVRNIWSLNMSLTKIYIQQTAPPRIGNRSILRHHQFRII